MKRWESIPQGPRCKPRRDRSCRLWGESIIINISFPLRKANLVLVSRNPLGKFSRLANPKGRLWSDGLGGPPTRPKRRALRAKLNGRSNNGRRLFVSSWEECTIGPWFWAAVFATLTLIWLYSIDGAAAAMEAIKRAKSFVRCIVGSR